MPKQEREVGSIQIQTLSLKDDKKEGDEEGLCSTEN